MIFFSNGDLKTASAIVSRVCNEASQSGAEIKWEDIHGLLEMAVYGGRIDTMDDDSASTPPPPPPVALTRASATAAALGQGTPVVSRSLLATEKVATRGGGAGGRGGAGRRERGACGADVARSGRDAEARPPGVVAVGEGVGGDVDVREEAHVVHLDVVGAHPLVP